jgi:ABC-2 type transport system permease protein
MDVKVDLDLFPQERNLSCKRNLCFKEQKQGRYWLRFVNYTDYETKLSFAKGTTLVSKDSVYNFNIYKLAKH